MTGYDNWEVDDDEEEDEEEAESRKEEIIDNFDSLDANVLNGTQFEEGSNNNRKDSPDGFDDAESGVPDHLRGDVLYSRSYHSGGGSTLVMASAKDMETDQDSQSSGRGSGSRVGSAHGGEHCAGNSGACHSQATARAATASHASRSSEAGSGRANS